jgi:hypothetical protein
MAGLVPATHAVPSLAAGSVKPRLAPSAWMDGTSPSMTAWGCVPNVAAMGHCISFLSSPATMRALLVPSCGPFFWTQPLPRSMSSFGFRPRIHAPRAVHRDRHEPVSSSR